MPTRLRLPRLTPTNETDYLNRRRFIQTIGAGAIAMSTAGIGCAATSDDMDDATRKRILRPGIDRDAILKQFPFHRNKAFDFDAKLTDELVAATYNNFYEFTTDKDEVWKLAEDMTTDPWTIEVTGLCHKPGRFDIDALYDKKRFSHEERTYRFRCVEAWAMDVPWNGFELNQLLKAVEPKSNAKFVRFVTDVQKKVMPGVTTKRATKDYPWPYFEGLRMDEAMNPLTLLAGGIFGRPLPRQHGAPFRLVVPWKYGYKSPKSIVKIELVEKQPKTLWETLAPHEYPFESNVNPEVPHPRWSQASERMIGTGKRRDTLLYNGYAEHVAKLYA